MSQIASLALKQNRHRPGRGRALFFVHFVDIVSSELWSENLLNLDHLVSDDKDLCQLAYDRGSLTKLADTVKAITPSDATAEWDEDEPESISCLREVSLHVVHRYICLL